MLQSLADKQSQSSLGMKSNAASKGNTVHHYGVNYGQMPLCKPNKLVVKIQPKSKSNRGANKTEVNRSAAQIKAIDCSNLLISQRDAPAL